MSVGPCARPAASRWSWRLLASVLVVWAVSCAPRATTHGSALTKQLAGKSTQEQLDLLRGLVASGHADSDVFFHMGNVFYAAGTLDSAIIYFGHAVGADSSNSKAWVNQGLVYDDQHQIAAARDAYQHALRINPKDVLAYCHLGFTYFEARDVRTALNYYEKALAIDPNSAQAHYNMGLAFADAKVFGEALTEWQKVIAADPDGKLGKTAAENVKLIKTYMDLGRK